MLNFVSVDSFNTTGQKIRFSYFESKILLEQIVYQYDKFKLLSYVEKTKKGKIINQEVYINKLINGKIIWLDMYFMDNYSSFSFHCYENNYPDSTQTETSWRSDTVYFNIYGLDQRTYSIKHELPNVKKLKLNKKGILKIKKKGLRDFRNDVLTFNTQGQLIHKTKKLEEYKSNIEFDYYYNSKGTINKIVETFIVIEENIETVKETLFTYQYY
jgi:hypothetical protein